MRNRLKASAITVTLAAVALNIGVAHAEAAPDAAPPLDPVAAMQGYADFMNEMLRANPTLGQSGLPTWSSADDLQQAIADFTNLMMRANPTMGHS